MMKRIFFYASLMALCFSCNSNDDAQPQNEDNFYALTVGNEWVYKNYKYNTNTQLYEDTGVIDSVSIVGTEELNGNKYYKFRTWTTGNENNNTMLGNENGERFQLLRDSLGYLISDDGFIKFTNNDYNAHELWSYPWGTIYEKLVEGETDMSVEAGTFTCLFSEVYAIGSSGNQLPGLDHYYYSDGIGLVFETNSFVSDPIPFIHRRLDSYSVQ